MTRWARVARGVTAAAVSTSIAAFSHYVAGGMLPSAVGLALCLSFSAIVCIALAEKRLSLVRLAAAVTASQAMFHGLFGMLSAPLAFAGSHGGHRHGEMAMPVEVARFGDSVPAGVAMSHIDPPMFAAHVSAATVTLVVLSYGERTVLGVFALGRLAIISMFWRITSEPLHPAINARATSTSDSLLVLYPLRMLSPMRHRGPPFALSA
ncbi:MAG: hypothetical protein ABIW81_03335 [Terrimesophilobacter sp.]